MHEQARQDIEQAQRLEPDAARLPVLWRDLYLALEDGAGMLPHAILLRDREPDDANHHCYLAIAQTLIGHMDQAAAAMTESNRLASAGQRERALKMLAALKADHPHYSERLEKLMAMLEEVSDA
jgi:predicted Zn-dependent protease